MTDLNLLLKHTSRSLYLSARLLPADVRTAFGTAYLLCRYADSIADTALLAPQVRAAWITRFPQLVAQPDNTLEQQLVQQISGHSANPYEEQLLRNLPACLEVFASLPVWQRQAVLEVVRAVCEGMQTDLQTFPPETASAVQAFSTPQDTCRYCRLMGGAPGEFWSKLIAGTVKLKIPEADFISLGRDIGDALQIVNILRDLPADLRIGRCYFPSEQLQAHGLQPADLLDPQKAAAFTPVKQYWISWGRTKLHAATAYLAALPKTQARHRAAVAWPALWAADTLNKLEAEPCLLNPKRRVKISRQRIYSTLALSPLLWLSNSFFNCWINQKLGPLPTEKNIF